MTGHLSMLTFLLTVFGGISTLLFLRLIGFTKFKAGELFLGTVVFFISIAIQSVTQQLPFLYLIFSRLVEGPTELNKYIAQGGIITIFIVSLWLGFIAGLVQSGFKYLFIKSKNYTDALNLGLGFGITEALYIGAIGMLATLLSGLEVPTTATYMQLVSALERFSATLFHIGSSLFIVDMIKKNKRLTGLLTIILLHGVLDTLAALYQLTGNFVVLLLVEFLVFLAGLFLTLKLYRYALTGSPEEIIW